VIPSSPVCREHHVQGGTCPLAFLSLPDAPNAEEVQSAFASAWGDEKTRAIEPVCLTEKIAPAAFNALIEQTIFQECGPLKAKWSWHKPSNPRVQRASQCLRAS
jgi:hypothetical protein